MKPFNACFAACMLLILSLVSACGRDTDPPVIRLNALDTMLVPLHSVISMPEAIAFDNEDLDVSESIVVTGTYEKDSIGYYPIQYEVTDAAGNVGRATCTLRVMVTPTQMNANFDRTTDCPNSGDDMVYIRSGSLDTNELVVAVFDAQGFSTGRMSFELLPNGEYEPMNMPFTFYNSPRIITGVEITFSADGNTFRLDLLGEDVTPFQCSATFTRR
jgi:hypothetical protein